MYFKIWNRVVIIMKYRLLSSVFYSDKDQYEELYQRRINSESTYLFDFKVNGYNGFVVINHNILQNIDKIMALDKKLQELIYHVPEIALRQYTKKCLIDEIRMTNQIEGVNSTKKEINDILNSNEKKAAKKRLYGLVKKYQLLEEEDISLEKCEDIRDLYDELVLAEVSEEDSRNIPDGVLFRKEVVYVESSSRKKIHKGIYPEEKIIQYMTDGLNILNNKEYNFLIRIAVFHYIFGYIHPFYDGNGRTSRFISSYLMSLKLEFLVSYRLSYTIKENINLYYKIFKEANDIKNRGDLTKFVTEFLSIISKSMEDLCYSLEERENKLNYFWNIINEKYPDDEKKQAIIFILVQNSLFGDSGLSIDEIKSISEVGISKTRNLLKELKEQNIVSVTKEGNKNIYELELNSLEALF